MTYEELEKEFEKKVEKLKRNCNHKNISGWSEEWWAMGHPTGFQIKVCKDCRTEMKKRIKCFRCGKWTEDYVNGDGKSRPVGVYFCKRCSQIKTKAKEKKR